MDIQNLNGVTWNNVTAVLLSSGGITPTGSPWTGTLGPGVTSIYQTFDCATANVTATLRLTSPEWAGNIDISWYAGPIYTACAVANLGGSATCGGNNLRFFGMTVTNVGYWKTDPSVACTFTGSANLHFVNLSGCVDSSTQTVQMDLLDCRTTATGADD